MDAGTGTGETPATVDADTGADATLESPTPEAGAATDAGAAPADAGAPVADTAAAMDAAGAAGDAASTDASAGAGATVDVGSAGGTTSAEAPAAGASADAGTTDAAAVGAATDAAAGGATADATPTTDAAAGAGPADAGAAAAAPATSGPLTADRIQLVGESGQTLSLGVRTPLGKHIVRQFGDDANVWDTEQLVIERGPDGWQVVPEAGTTNETLLNGAPITGPQPLHDGDVIAVGRAEKGISRLPLTVRAA
ncbi:MAG TPA: FHA domain-containing protein [Longimicrobium sp.]|nr:FHA domain-containing protein [Longimicrobium sp.]